MKPNKFKDVQQIIASDINYLKTLTMKKPITFKALSSKAKIASLAIALIVLSSFNNNNKITICHVPPGNPGNCHEITISMSALQAHLNHGDKLYCEREADYNKYLMLVDNNMERVVKLY